MKKARGSDDAACFRFGDGPFEAGAFADGLVLSPDSPRHAVVEPASRMPLADFEAALAATRAGWIIDEA